MWIGVIFIPIGLILAIVGAITSPKEHHIYSHNYQHQQYPQQQYVQPIAQQSQNFQIKYCPNCGTQSTYQAQFCKECGFKF